jgi:hypothetical protein
MRNEKTRRVYSVLYYDEKSAGPAGDCTHIMRFASAARAAEFAKGREVYGKPCTVDADDVPERIAQRWSIA